jgi:hypothetical protein
MRGSKAQSCIGGITPQKPLPVFRDRALEHFQAKWTPVRVKKMRRNKNIEPRSDSIGTDTLARIPPGLTHSSEKNTRRFNWLEQPNISRIRGISGV